MTCGMIVPNEEVLSVRQCDFQEGLWHRGEDIMIPVTNWGNVPTFIKKHSQIGRIEPVDPVSNEDPHWKIEQTDSQCAVRTSQLGGGERDTILGERLRIGDAVTDKQKEELVNVLVKVSKAFALDDELGETSVVEHSIDTKDAPPVSTNPRRIPYSLRTELEKELENL